MDPTPEDTPPPEEEIPIPPTVRFRMLSLLWCFPTSGAVWILGSGARHWDFTKGTLAGLEGIRIEEWIALLLLILHGVWIWKWRQSRSPSA